MKKIKNEPTESRSFEVSPLYRPTSGWEEGNGRNDPSEPEPDLFLMAAGLLLYIVLALGVLAVIAAISYGLVSLLLWIK